MKTFTHLFILVFLSAVGPAIAQTSDLSTFHGAEPTKTKYRAAYQLNTSDTLQIISTLLNIQNALNDPRLKGKLDVELVVHGPGVAVFRKESKFEKTLQGLQKQGVILAMCENTMRRNNISHDALFPFISYVPSGNGELIIREQEGWAVIHP